MIHWTAPIKRIIERNRGRSSPGPKRFRIIGVIILEIRKALIVGAQSKTEKSSESHHLQRQHADKAPETLQPLQLPSAIHIPFFNPTDRLPIPIPYRDRELDWTMSYCHQRPLEFLNQCKWYGYAASFGVYPDYFIIPLRDYHFNAATHTSGFHPVDGTGHQGARSVRLGGHFDIRARDLTLEAYCGITDQRISTGLLSQGPLGLFGSVEMQWPDGSSDTSSAMVWLWKEDWAR